LVFFDQPGVENIDIDRWKSANFTTMNIWETQNPQLRSRLPEGMAWGRMYLPGQPSTYLYPEELPYLPQLVSLQYADEIQAFTPEILNEIRTTFRYWNEHYPNTLAYTNFGGPTGYISETDLTHFINFTQPDMLSFDVYPHRYGTPLSHWYSAMQKYRVAALAGYTTDDGINSGPLPYAQFLYTALGTVDTPLPTVSFIRLQQNASWALGYTFVNVFTYNSYNQTDIPSAMFKGMGDAQPTAVVDYVKETNRQSLNLGPALVRLLSTDVRMLVGRVPNDNPRDPDGDTGSLPDRMNSTSTTWGHPFITDISVTNIGNVNFQQTDSARNPLPGDVLLGYFKVLDESLDGPDVTDETYFMVVNGLVEVENAPAGDTQQRIIMCFDFGDSTITSLQRLSRETGQVEVVPLVHDGGSKYHVELVLDGGEGDLFKFNTGTAFVYELGKS
jgi:hypothetical protein